MLNLTDRTQSRVFILSLTLVEIENKCVRVQLCLYTGVSPRAVPGACPGERQCQEGRFTPFTLFRAQLPLRIGVKVVKLHTK